MRVSSSRLLSHWYLTDQYRHILSNVGRVTARDSSKASATVQDLFVALCEDNAIYGLFRSMKGAYWFAFEVIPRLMTFSVYEQIELLSKASKPRRSKSLSVGEKPLSASNLSDLTGTKGSGSSQLNSRVSSESSASGTALGSSSGVNSSSRASSEKTRSMKMFGKTSTDGNGESQRNHRKSDSVRSAETRNALSHSSTVKPFEVTPLVLFPKWSVPYLTLSF
jgi:hypothetical protein